MIHYANRDDKLGKKIFLWSQSDAGKIWEELLTDDSGQYVEIQSGRLFNQNVAKSSETPFKQIGFKPYSSEQWTEYWYPFNGLGGFTHANKTGAFKIDMLPNQVLSVKMCPVQSINDSLNVFNSKRQIIGSVYVNADPLQTVSVEIKLPENETAVRLVLTGESVVMANKHSQKKSSRPMQIAENFDTESTYGLYLQGRDLYRFRNYHLAEDKINASLVKDQLFLPSLVEMAKIKMFRMEYDSAFYYAKKALSIDTYDGEANYYYGLAASKLSNDIDALDGFEVAALTPNYRTAAYSSLAKQYLSKQDYKKAKEYVLLSITNNPNNIDAIQVQHVLARIQNNHELVKETREQIENLNPLNHFINHLLIVMSKTSSHVFKMNYLLNLISNWQFGMPMLIELVRAFKY